MTEIKPSEGAAALLPHAGTATEAATTKPATAISTSSVDILVLGAGWLSQFLLPLLKSRDISYAATSTTGRDDTIPFKFDPNSEDLEQYRRLPNATTILITFPLVASSRAARKAAMAAAAGTDKAATQAQTPTAPSQQPLPPSSSSPESKAAPHLLNSYRLTHPSIPQPHYILLGSTGEWTTPGWHDRHSNPHSPTSSSLPSARWTSESSLLSLGGTVLHLAGLFGDVHRTSRIWELAVPRTKEGVKGKGGVHFIHGGDVARAVVAVHLSGREEGVWEKNGKGQRWIVTDGRVYDWWGLVWEAAGELDGRFDGDVVDGDDGGRDVVGKGEDTYRQWLLESMREEGVRGLPREGEKLGRRMDSREFWETWGLVPIEKGFAWPAAKESSKEDVRL
ncbi:uncharacterized protein AB675_732 [Cyphellophora attinorum]|uniref:Uncharacterized protein n=1 Tax=Cyphellophora attinorum TaxID=1664694 RepID=A0A0N1I1H4_9EURO|nr:uncharacterized protein AB675_732 [Phialophora attinorum]KPI45716.1 hypothetical protein AB675_732 [Phialophora attinorum]